MRRPSHEIPEGTKINRSSGVGHIPGDPEQSTTKMVPVQVAKRYMEYDRTGQQAYPQSEQIINDLANHLRGGGIIHTPVYISHSTEHNWGFLAEGHHRVEAAERAGLTHIPLTVFTRESDSSVAKNKEQHRGAPLHMDTDWHKASGMINYQPPNAHPDHFRELR